MYIFDPCLALVNKTFAFLSVKWAVFSSHMQIKASLLLSSHGQEIPKISDRLKSLGSAAVDAPDVASSTVCDTDIEGITVLKSL